MRLIKRLLRRKRRMVMLLWLVLAIHDRIDAQTLVPAPTPTVTPIPVDGLYESLEEANSDITGLGPDLSAPQGVELLPDEDGSEIFRYAKWLLAPSSADELAGPFAPIIVHTGIFVTLTIALAVVYGVVYVAIYLLKFVVWLFKLILFVIQVVVSVIGSIFKFFF